MLGIRRFGAYIPRMRLDRKAIASAHAWMAPSLRGQAKGERAFTSWDEDTVTMAVEAARDALAGEDRSAIDALTFASTRAPYADLQSSAIVADALDLDRGIETMDAANSQRAGMSALMAALRGEGHGLFVASDAPLGKPASTQEMAYGAGAAAFLLDSEDVAAKLIGHASVSANFVDHFRAADARYDYFWEDRWIRDEAYLKLAPQAIAAALDRAGIAIGDITHLAMPSLLRGGAAATAKKIKFAGTLVDDLAAGCGYAGCAHAPLMLVSALETAAPGDRIMVVGFGQGCDVLIFEATDRIGKASCRGVAGSLANGLTTDSYLRMLSFSDGIDLEWGMRSEKNGKTALSEQYRSSDQIAGFNAGKCGECGTIQFPQLEYCVNPDCNAPAEQFVRESLSDAPAKVLTYTADWLSYHPAPPLYVGFVQFENGARVLMEMVDVGPDGVDVGMPLRMVLRVKEKDRERGYRRYFWKATPITGEGAN